MHFKCTGFLIQYLYRKGGGRRYHLYGNKYGMLSAALDSRTEIKLYVCTIFINGFVRSVSLEDP